MAEKSRKGKVTVVRAPDSDLALTLAGLAAGAALLTAFALAIPGA